MTAANDHRRSHPLMVVQVLLLALALSGGPVAAANPGHERGPGLDPATAHADVQQVLRGSLRRLAAGGLTQPMREELLRGTPGATSRPTRTSACPCRWPVTAS